MTEPLVLLIADEASAFATDLLEAAGWALAGRGLGLDALALGALSPRTRSDDPVLKAALARVAAADAVVFGAGESGDRMAAFLGRLPAGAFVDRWAWWLTAVGSAAASPPALRAALDRLGARRWLASVHATDRQVVRRPGAVNATLAIEIAWQLNRGAAELAAALDADRQQRRVCPPVEPLEAACSA